MRCVKKGFAAQSARFGLGLWLRLLLGLEGTWSGFVANCKAHALLLQLLLSTACHFHFRCCRVQLAKVAEAMAAKTASAPQTDITSLPSCLDPVLPCTVLKQTVHKKTVPTRRKLASARQECRSSLEGNSLNVSAAFSHSKVGQDAETTNVVLIRHTRHVGDKQCLSFYATNVARTQSQTRPVCGGLRYLRIRDSGLP